MFYKVVDDTDHPTSWWLGKVLYRGNRVDLGELTSGRRFSADERLTVDVRRPGEPMELSFTLRNVPVATTRVAEAIERVAPQTIERIPIEVDGHTGRYEVINVVQVIDAVDRERSHYILWSPDDGRPDMVGQFRQVHPLVIRNDIRQNAGIFRCAGWEVALVVSATLKRELEKLGELGVLFRPLEGGVTAN